MATGVVPEMADIVKSALTAILEDEDFKLNTPRMLLAKETVQKLFKSANDEQDAFIEFTANILREIDVLATPNSQSKLSSQRKELWSQFHVSRTSKLRSLWSKLYTDLNVDSKAAKDPLLIEYVNEKLFEGCVKAKFHIEEQQIEPPKMTEDDLNALRYAAGFVPWKLQQKYRKTTCNHPHRQSYLVCLAGMSDSTEEDECTFLEYTKRWIATIDRGGLFHISDEVYLFFYQVECIVRKLLLEVLTINTQHGRKEIIDEVTSNDTVQFHWSIIAVEVDEDVGQELLAEIVQLWLTIRGFSTAGAFVEHYKQITKKSVTKSSSLRKGLKRKKLDMNNDDT